MSIVISSPLYINRVSVAIVGGDGQYMYYTDGTIYYRKGVRDSSFVIDKTLTITGFAGSENTDWENLFIIA